MLRASIYLACAIFFEVIGTTSLKLSNGFTNFIPSLFVIVGFGVAFFLLAKAIITLPLSFAYSVWAGSGTALTALVGFFLFNETITMQTLLGLILIIGGVISLNIFTSKN
ncbi:multidrug efflux SMR transporter [Bacillus sp. JCM 19041]|uniref:DMT family transporter n=1 Tax=Bacillus sp. JCM 19041 TaxID=1460637 RepID=UPI0006D1E117